LESLTNARKHAVGGSVTVRLAYGPPVTTVSVDNTLGSASSDAAPSGYGLVGLRERVLALGGEFEAGPIDEGGWRVSARIPHPHPVEQDWQEK
jgi:signal transduction histidine kinase